MVVNPHSRPTNLPNLWVSKKTTFAQPEWIDLKWIKPHEIASVQVIFDSSLHFHFGQSWQGYAVNAVPTIVKQYRIIAGLADGSEVLLAEVLNNHQRNVDHQISQREVVLIRIECNSTHGIDRAQVYSVRVIEKIGDNSF